MTNESTGIPWSTSLLPVNELNTTHSDLSYFHVIINLAVKKIMNRKEIPRQRQPKEYL